MKMHELFSRIDQSPKNEQFIEIELWANAFDLNIPFGSDIDEQLSERFKGYWLTRWLCTDARVGCALWFLDGNPIGLTHQSARKNSIDVSFVSNEAAETLRTTLIEMIKPSYDLINMDEEVGETYRVAYGSQLLTKQGIVDDQPVTVVQTFDSYNEIDKWRSVVIQTHDGQQKTVSTDDFHIPFPLKE